MYCNVLCNSWYKLCVVHQEGNMDQGEVDKHRKKAAVFATALFVLCK